jgi:chemotaxis protein methyltransferase CheR
VNDRDLELVASLCAERAGILVDPERGYLVENRLGPVARREGFGAIEELIGAIRERDDQRLTWAVVEAMWPAETGFFRDPEVFELIAQRLLPQLAAATGRNRPMKLWAAACGGGQEVYSLAMLLAEEPPPGAFELYGTDLCERRLEKGQAGLYSQFEVQRGLSAHRLVRHFEGVEGGFALSPRLRQSVRWRRANLTEDLGRLGQLDLVVCRDLLSALTPLARERAVANLTAAIAPGGFLVLGREEAAAGLVAAPGLPGCFTKPAAERAAA